MVERNWQACLTDASIRENSGFHGENLAPTGPQITDLYPPSFIHVGFPGGFNNFRPDGTAQTGENVPVSDSAGA
jgi:hypothetical protein